MFLDATAQAALVRHGEATPLELVDLAVQRIGELDPELNAVTVPLFDKARAEAGTAPPGPFRGVPYAIKDLALVSRGDPTCQGIAAARAAGYRADHDSYFVASMRAAGFVLVGKTNLPELGGSLTHTASPAWGETRNPWHPARSPGGSSGGSAAAVAAGMVAVAEGTDATGSVRVPASLCGVVGLKGSRGRISSGPGAFCDELAGLRSEGLVARSVRDVAAVLDVVSGHRPGDPFCAPAPPSPDAGAGRLRIGVLTTDPSGSSAVAAACVTGARRAADALAALGHEVAEDFPRALAESWFWGSFGLVMAVARARSLAVWNRRLGRPLTAADVEPGTWAEARQGAIVSGEQYAEGIDALRAHGREIERWWEDDGWDVLLTPTLPVTAYPLDRPPPGNLAVFTSPFNVSGQPAVSLPVHEDATGMPVGVQLVAGYGREDVLLRVAAQLETALPWAHRHPRARVARVGQGVRRGVRAP